MPSAAAAVVAAGTSYGLTRYAVGRRTAHPSRWTRLNHAGEPVTLGGGPAAVIGVLAGLVLAKVVTNDSSDGVSRVVPDHFRHRERQGYGPVALAVLGAGAVGLVDDLVEGEQAKGFRGHLGALRHGRLTTGMIKIAGVGLTALASCTWVAVRRPGGGRVVDVVLDTVLVAGAANLTNLLDLRPGRAGKVVAVTALALSRRGGAPILGAVVGALPADLAGQAMLGDSGANGLGAAVATVAVRRLSQRGRLLALIVVAGLNVASERVSFSVVIDATPVLRRLDQVGRPPVVADPATTTEDPG
ncbi:MAG: hypothetical protein ACR2LI_14295 [Propionibacteriaceae bacterium]